MPLLIFPEQVLATVLHLRAAVAAEPLSVLFGTSRTAVHRILPKNWRLLEKHGITIPPAAIPPTTLAALQARGQARTNVDNRIKSTC